MPAPYVLAVTRRRPRTGPDGHRSDIRPDGTIVLPAGTRTPDRPSDLARIARERLARARRERPSAVSDDR